MKELLPYLVGGGLGLGGISIFIWNVIKGARAEKDVFIKARAIALETLEKAQFDLILVIKQEAAAWSKRYTDEHNELVEYRKLVHERRGKTQAELLRLTGECERLKSLTDLTPIFRFQEEQSQINAKVLKSLSAIVKHLALVLENGK